MHRDAALTDLLSNQFITRLSRQAFQLQCDLRQCLHV